MKSKLLFTCAILTMAGGTVQAQIKGDVLGVHDLSRANGSPVTGGLPGSCYYCHAPHSGIGGMTPLWNQKLSNQTYSAYTSTTDPSMGNAQPPPGSDSLLCLSCHDGTVAPGTTQAYGTIAMTGSLKSPDVNNLQTSHPTSLALPMRDAPYLVSSLVSSGKTADPTGAVHLVKGNVECTTCHAPHVQSIDKVSQNFLVRDSSSGQMCLACHDPNRITNGQQNQLAQWSTSAHAVATNTVGNATSASVGDYHSVAQNACISCHAPHNAPTPVRLLRAPNEQDCMLCHSGGSNISPAIPNVFSEFAKVGHPFPAANNQHDAAEPAVLNENRHSTCVDCHNPHSSNKVQTFTYPPLVRGSQNNIEGVSGNDGVTAVKPAINQYENCLRCHGTSIGKTANPIYGYLPLWEVSASDPLNVIPQFALTAPSSHPVMHNSNSPLPQPSLRPYMLNFDGITQGRPMGNQILCTDCHNSDDNRESGGAGPNGPHGSKYPHILERRYEFSQAPSPGAQIVNLFPGADLTSAGPYALCAKCHDLVQLMGGSSWLYHGLHIGSGFSCSTCHTAHGLGTTSPFIDGERLVNFDLNVVAQNATTPVAYSRAQNTCILICHGVVHPIVSSNSPPATGPPVISSAKHRK
jgi:predicted CXXCH cytochrome family protein